MGGIPRQVLKEAPDAKEWLDQGRRIDTKVADKLKAVHQQRLQALNETRKAKPVYKAGDKVWLLRPRHVGTDKLLSWWIGPCPVVARQGADSYLVEDKPGRQRAAHASQLKPYVEDEFADAPVPLHYFRQTEVDLSDEVDEWEVEEITGHKVGDDGQLWFRTKWAGFDAPTWEPLGNFVHRYNVDWAEYCKRHGVNANVIDHLLGARAQVQTTVSQVIGSVGGPLSQTCDGWASSGLSSTICNTILGAQ